MWQLIPGSYVVNMTQELDASDIQPWAEAKYREHLENFARDPGCFLPSGPRYYITGTPKIVQTPELIVVLNDDLTYRQIFLDGRRLPDDPNPNFMGYSTAHWDGDTLIVESKGFTDRTLLDTGGHPHTEALRVTERLRRRDFGHMDLQVTFEDPALYAKPMVVPVRMRFVADDELIEYICRENEQDYAHIGHASDEMVSVPADVLKGVGTYETGAPGEANYRIVNVSFDGMRLFVDRTVWSGGNDKQPLIPLSETLFAGNFGRRMRFVKDEQGAVTSLIFESPEPFVNDVTTKRRRN
jgi:hypothetical protein